MKRTTLVLAALALLLLVTPYSRAGLITATLSAQPGTISEGGSTTFTLSVTDQPYGGFYNRSGGAGAYTDYYYNGTGYMSSVVAQINPGAGQAPIVIGANPGSTTFSTQPDAQYPLPGTYTATLSGSVSSWDNLTGYNYWWNGFYYEFAGSFNAGSNESAASISGSTQVHVNNVAPTITQITWTPEVLAGQDFAFSATATDPGLPGGETLTFGFDLNGTGQYGDFSKSGVTTDGGAYHFDTPGVYTIGVKVTDSYGASTLGSFNVQVDALGAPEPASLTLLGLGGLCLGGCAWRRHKAASPVA